MMKMLVGSLSQEHAGDGVSDYASELRGELGAPFEDGGDGFGGAVCSSSSRGKPCDAACFFAETNFFCPCRNWMTCSNPSAITSVSVYHMCS